MKATRYLWDTFATVKRDQLYLSRKMESLDRIERALNMTSAIASSAAIAGWAIWQHAAFVWACVIAASQLYQAVRPFLPFGSQLRALHNLYPEIEGLAMFAERNWIRVAQGQLTEEEMIDCATQIKEKKIAATQKHLKGILVPERKKFVHLANGQAVSYMENFLEE
jgi:hypothetical protein